MHFSPCVVVTPRTPYTFRDFDTLRFDTIRFDTIRFDTLRFDTMRFDTLRFDTFMCFHVSVMCRDVNCNMVHFFNKMLCAQKRRAAI